MTPRKDTILLAGFLFFSLLCRKKTMGNKTVFFLLLGGILSACTPLDEPPAGGYFRRPPADTPSAVTDSLQQSLPEPPAPVPDTLLYCSAVRFPDDYDWQRDTAYSAVPFELLLYRDGTPVLTLAWDQDACFGPDPDLHHLLDGHLYTERMSGTQTRVGCDGTELFRFDGREFLVGLLPDGEDLYTLSRKTSGAGGFSYRRNGTVLLESDTGMPFGDLSDSSYSPTGALYRDGGAIVFCYQEGTDVRLVRDGVAATLEERFLPGTLLDCKLHDGRETLLQTDYAGALVYSGRLWFHETGSVVTGYFFSGRARGFSGWMDGSTDTFPRQLCREEAILFYGPEGAFAISADAAGNVRWYGPDGAGSAGLPARLFSPKCAAVAGGRPLLALTPLDTSLPPRLTWGTRKWEISLNGYISAVAVELSLPAS